MTQDSRETVQPPRDRNQAEVAARDSQDKDSRALSRLWAALAARLNLTWAIWTVATLLFLLVLFSALRLAGVLSLPGEAPLLAGETMQQIPDESPGVFANTTPDAQTGAVNGSVRARVNNEFYPFEEALGAPLEEEVKLVDHALIQSVAAAKLGTGGLRLLAVEWRRAGDLEYHYQTIELQLPEDSSDDFMRQFEQSLQGLRANATLSRLDEIGWQVAVDGQPTHRLLLRTPDGRPALPLPPRLDARGRLAIVIDDLGESESFARSLAALDVPVTFSVWPRSSKTSQVAAIGHAAGLEIMLHQPMQPESWPRVKPGPGALYISMNATEVRRVVAENLDKVPWAVGLNNHMGSAFTQSVEGMDAVIQVLNERGLVILDSLTHPRSAVMAEARKLGIEAYRRDVFLDVVKDVDAVVFQLEKAERLALSHGRAVAIGHPYPETLEGLKRWSAKRDPELAVVALKELDPPVLAGAANATAVY